MVIKGTITYVTKNKGGYHFIIGIVKDSRLVQTCMKNQGYKIDTQDIQDFDTKGDYNNNEKVINNDLEKNKDGHLASKNDKNQI